MSVDCGNQSAKTYVNTPVEEVVHLVTIDLHVGHGNPIVLRAVLEKEVHNARNDARIGFSALDGVGLARRGHSVREYSDGLRNVKISFARVFTPATGSSPVPPRHGRAVLVRLCPRCPLGMRQARTRTGT